MGVLRKEREEGRGCWFWNEDVGEAGEVALEFGWDECSKDWSAPTLTATAAMVFRLTVW